MSALFLSHFLTIFEFNREYVIGLFDFVKSPYLSIKSSDPKYIMHLQYVSHGASMCCAVGLFIWTMRQIKLHGFDLLPFAFT